MMLTSTGAKPKPVLDEGGFQQLLAAAYVLQQHNDSLHAKDPRLDAAWIFSQISETENLVRQGGRSFTDSARLVGDRLCGMTGAVSASVCLLHDGRADCVSESGVAAQAAGQSLAAVSSVAEERLRNGRQFQSLDAQSDSRLDKDLCLELGVRSLLAVPIQKSGVTTGLIEVRWGLANAIHECDVRTCRLMANLLAEVLERDGSMHVPEAGLLPRQALGDHPDEAENGLNLKMTADLGDSKQGKAPPDLAEHCRVCGRPFSSDEAFCGHCSMPRVAASNNGEGLQSKWASMWFMQQAQKARPQRRAVGSKFLPVSPSVPKPLMAASAKPPEPPNVTSQAPAEPAAPANSESTFASSKFNKAWPLSYPTNEEIGDHSVPEHSLRILEAESTSDLDSQPSASFLSQLRSLLSVRIKISRRTIALAVCTIIAFVFLATWLSWPAESASHLSWFDSLLVDLGLAEVQARRPAPVYSGNPNTRVWEDVHTALYYCPDSDLYGKTPGGRFSTQRSAQEDQFEPATRIACQ